MYDFNSSFALCTTSASDVEADPALPLPRKRQPLASTENGGNASTHPCDDLSPASRCDENVNESPQPPQPSPTTPSPSAPSMASALPVPPGQPGSPEPPVSTAPPTPCEALASDYESRRRYMLRWRLSVLAEPYSPETLLDQADPETLSEAADLILMGQAAREAIRSAARLEQAWRTNRQESTAIHYMTPADELVRTLTGERDRAAAFLYDLKKRQGKLRHLEASTRRTLAAAKQLEKTVESPSYLSKAAYNEKGELYESQQTSCTGTRTDITRHARPEQRLAGQLGEKRRATTPSLPATRSCHRSKPAALAGTACRSDLAG